MSIPGTYYYATTVTKKEIMPTATYLHQWATAFAITLALEASVIIILLPRVSRIKLTATFLIANGTSHPFLWFAFPQFEPYAAWVVVAEVTITSYEALLYWATLRNRISLGKALLVSTLANATSCVLGLVIRAL